MYGDSLLVTKTSVTIKKLKSKEILLQSKSIKKYGSRKVLSKKWSNVKRVKNKIRFFATNNVLFKGLL